MSSEKIIVLLSAEKNNSPLERWKQTILHLSAEKTTILFLSAEKNFSFWALKKAFLLLSSKNSILLLSAEKNSSPFERWKNQFSWELKKILLLSAEKKHSL